MKMGGLRRFTFRCLISSAGLVGGCQTLLDSGVPATIRQVAEPESGRKYLLYRPSNYDRNLAWPLLVVCAAAFPDSPDQQIRDWTQLAERHGFLVCAPEVRASRSELFGSIEAGASALRDDERVILATIRHVRAAHTISDDRIFLYGWASGAQPAIYTGLRHPELFRAVATIQPKIVPDALAAARSAVDPHQPVMVYSNAADALWGRPAGECVDWLRNVGADVKEDPTGPARRTDGTRAVDFFDQVIRTRPWIHVDAGAGDPSRPAEFRLSLRSSFKPAAVRWRFGDGAESDQPEPVHTYARPGVYRVEVELRDSQGRIHDRSVDLTVRS